MKAFLVVDIHGCFGWYAEQIEVDQTKKQVALATKNKLKEARRGGEIIIFAMMPDCGGQEFQISKNRKCIGCDTADPLAEFLEHRHGYEYEAVFYKNRSNAFINLNLAEYLRSKSVTEIVLLGCTTFGCVLSTALGALENGFNVTLPADCTYPPLETYYEGNGKKQWLEIARTRAKLTNNNLVQIE